MAAAPEKFWMVVGDGPAAFRHKSRVDAVREARRLAGMNRGVMFVVVEAVSFARAVDVETGVFDPADDGVPF
jgi:hypothetical protein